MAAHPIQAGTPDVVGQIVLLPVAEVEIGKRLRPVDETWAEALGQIMQVEGQKTSIEVCRLPGHSNWTLVAGAHRLTGAKAVGITYIRAIVVEADPAERLSREISENLWRRGLDPVDRAAFIAELVTLHKQRNGIDPEQDGRATSAAIRWQKQLQSEADDATITMNVAYGWSDEIGEKLGLSAVSIRRDLLLHRRLSPSVLYQLRTCFFGGAHPILKNATQLRALAKLSERQQETVVGLLIADSAKTVTEARAILDQKQKRSPDDKYLAAFIGAFSRMSLAGKKAALTQLPLSKSVTLGGLNEQADLALREAWVVLGLLLDGALEVGNPMLQSAYDACGAALSKGRGQ